MKKISILLFISSGLMVGQAFAIDPIYEGENGIRTKVFETICLQCHSSELSGLSRNGAPLGINFDTYEVAFTQGDVIIDRAVTQMNMPPAFSGFPMLNDKQKQALTNWQTLEFPEKKLPPIYDSTTKVLKMPAVYIINSNGTIDSKISADMAIITNKQTIQFELIHFHEIID